MIERKIVENDDFMNSYPQKPYSDSSNIRPIKVGNMANQFGAVEEVKVGYSFTTLFFGPLAALFRGDLKWFFIMLISDALILPWLIWPAVYNHFFIKELLERGYRPCTPELAAALRNDGFYTV